MSRQIGIGLIGLGWMGEVHSRSYRLVPDRFSDCGVRPRLVICADEVESRARSSAERFGFERYTTDWQQVIADPDVHAVNITAPNNLHLPIAVAAARAGKHILCEKPVGRNPEETAVIEREARKTGVLTFVGYNYRWAPLVQYSKQLLDQQRLGAISHYRGRFFCGYAADPNNVLSWRFLANEAGCGTVGDLMSHVADMAHMLAGPIKKVVAQRETFIRRRPIAEPGTGTHFTTRSDGPLGDVTNEDYVGALVEFSSGARGTFEVCRTIQGPKCQMAFEVNGTKGALNWDFERMNELNLMLSDGEAASEGYRRVLSTPQHPFHQNFSPSPANSLSYEDLKVIEAYQFLSSIAEGRQRQPGFSEALAVANVQAAMIRSWETGSWEEVRPIPAAAPPPPRSQSSHG
jgi:predicted dehydrogenase